jgi:hypothetical protein
MTKVPETYYGEKTTSATNVAGKLDICKQKTETRSISFICMSINAKWINDLT